MLHDDKQTGVEQLQRNYKDKNFILYSIYLIWKTGSRWYISDLHVINIDSRPIVPAWQQSLYSSLKEIGVKNQYVGGDSLLHVYVCYKSRPRLLFVKSSAQMEVTGSGVETLTWNAHNLTPAVT
jgi:hypothetical protein